MNVEMPNPCFYDRIIHTLDEHDILNFCFNHVNFNIAPRTYFSPSALSYLASWGSYQLNFGANFSFSGDPDILNYLSRMNLFNNLQFYFKETFIRRNETGRFVTLSKIEDENDVEKAYENICNLIVSYFDNSREFLPAVDWALYEILDNVISHAQSTTPAFVSAQYLKQKNKLIVSVCDYGRGLKKSLEEKHIVEDYRDAIVKAITKGTTRTDEHLGNGLAGTLEICNKNRGTFSIWSGDCTYVKSATDEFFKPLPFSNGTGILLNLFIENPVDLEDTLVRENEITYIYRLADRLNPSKGIIVRDECNNCGLRPPGERLRRKVEAILPDLDHTLLLNFEGIDSITSSFADELVAKLYVKLGHDYFMQKIGFINASELLMKIINSVIGQRMAKKLKGIETAET